MLEQLEDAYTKGYLALVNARLDDDEDGISLSLEQVGIGAAIIAIVTAIAALAVPAFRTLVTDLIDGARDLLP